MERKFPNYIPKKKVLVISSEFPPGPGGLGNHAYNLCKSLNKKGLNVYVLTTGDYAESREIQVFDNNQKFKITRFKRKGINTYPLRFTLTLKMIKAFKPHEIILSGKFPVWMTRWLKKKWPYIILRVFLHGSEVRLSQGWARWLYYYNIQKADMYHPVSLFTYNLLPEKIKNGHPYQILPNGIDIYELGELNNKQVPSRLKGDPALLTVGNVTPRKGQHRVIQALPELIRKYPNIHYHIVGIPTHKESLLQLSNRINVSNYITFHGQAKDRETLASFYKSCDIFIMLSENQPNGDVEGFGIAILEANYFGKPAIGARGCGIEAAIKNHYNGILVNGDNTSEILNAIQEILTHQKYYEAQPKTWSIKHNWDEIVENIIE